MERWFIFSNFQSNKVTPAKIKVWCLASYLSYWCLDWPSYPLVSDNTKRIFNAQKNGLHNGCFSLIPDIKALYATSLEYICVSLRHCCTPLAGFVLGAEKKTLGLNERKKCLKEKEVEREERMKVGTKIRRKGKGRL